MPHSYEIVTGRWEYGGKLICVCHAGTDDDGDGVTDPGEGLNDPKMIAVKGVGPLPPGIYEIGDPFDHPTAGPFTMRLTPLTTMAMFDRSGFLFHGGGAKASRGCIVGQRPGREEVWSIIKRTGDRRLVVAATKEQM